VAPGELVALLGPSGSGKTTLLCLIADLDFPTSGQVLFGGEDTFRRHARERRVGFVFQHYALFRHMTVADNIAFGLRVKPRRERLPETVIKARVSELLSLVQLDGLARRYPAQLSGGQRQRVALARALAIAPRVLLLNEPFGALDARVRKELRRWLRGLHDRMGLTSLFVTHDQEEALKLADRIVVMNRGRIEQVGAPGEVYEHPASPLVCEFLGDVNRFDCVVAGGRASVLDSDFAAAVTGLADGPAVAYVRPHDIEIVTQRSTVGLPAIVRHVADAGPLVVVELGVQSIERPVEVMLARHEAAGLAMQRGLSVFLRARRVQLFLAPIH